MAEASLRQAAAALHMPLTSLRRLVAAEPTLSACVRPAGPRRPAGVDLPRLLAAWQHLQAPCPQQNDLSPRQQLSIERRRRLWWQAEVLRLEVEALEQDLIAADEVAAAEARSLAQLEQGLNGWLDAVAPQLPGMAGADADRLMQRTAVECLQQLCAKHQPDPKPDPPPTLAPLPDPLPDEATLRAAIERHRGALHRIAAQQRTGEKVDAAAAMRRAAGDALRRRDQFLSLAARHGPAARMWRSESQARTQLGREVSAILAPA